MTIVRWDNLDRKVCGIYTSIDDVIHEGPEKISHRDLTLIAKHFSRLMYTYGYPDYAPIKRKERGRAK